MIEGRNTIPSSSLEYGQISNIQYMYSLCRVATSLPVRWKHLFIYVYIYMSGRCMFLAPPPTHGMGRDSCTSSTSTYYKGTSRLHGNATIRAIVASNAFLQCKS